MQQVDGAVENLLSEVLQMPESKITDDLAIVFSEWLTKRPGFLQIPETQISSGLPTGLRVEEFEFPY